jgi:hypothetical protein
MSQPGIEPGPPAWEASTLEKSHPDSLIFASRKIYISMSRNNLIFFARQFYFVTFTIVFLLFRKVIDINKAKKGSFGPLVLAYRSETNLILTHIINQNFGSIIENKRTKLAKRSSDRSCFYSV